MSSIKTIVTLALITALSIVSIGCSDSTDPVAVVADPPVVVVDTAPPAVPANLDALFADGLVTLSWDANNTDADLAGFVLRRDNYGEITSLVGSPTIFQSYQDAPAVGLNTYEIYSVDQVGNESAIASIEYRVYGERNDDNYTEF
jgi:hypothetical protein